MSLPVLVALVVVGIALSVLAVHFTGGSKIATLAGADQALSRFADDFPDVRFFDAQFDDERVGAADFGDGLYLGNQRGFSRCIRQILS